VNDDEITEILVATDDNMIRIFKQEEILFEI